MTVGQLIERLQDLVRNEDCAGYQVLMLDNEPLDHIDITHVDEGEGMVWFS